MRPKGAEGPRLPSDAGLARAQSRQEASAKGETMAEDREPAEPTSDYVGWTGRFGRRGRGRAGGLGRRRRRGVFRRLRPHSPVPETPAPAEAAEAITALVHVASYLGTAAVGGVIGNRADAALTAVTRRVLRRHRQAGRLFGAVRDRWQYRQTSAPVPGPATTAAPLIEQEAVDAALAAAMADGWSWARVVHTGLRTDGVWRVNLFADTEILTVFIPPGDPARATIKIYGPDRTKRRHRRR